MSLNPENTPPTTPLLQPLGESDLQPQPASSYIEIELAMKDAIEEPELYEAYRQQKMAHYQAMATHAVRATVENRTQASATIMDAQNYYKALDYLHDNSL